MGNLSFAKMFVENALAKTGSFELTNRDGFKYSYMQHQVNGARYIYSRGYSKDGVVSSLRERNIRVAAIVADGEVYIVDEFDVLATRFTDEDYAEIGAKSFYKEKERINSEVVEADMFPKWYESLSDDKEIDMESEKYRLKKQARENILKGKMQKVECDEKMYITEQQYADILCGIRKLEDTVSENLENQSRNYTYFKTRDKFIRKFMETEELVSSWEMRMYKALEAIDAKTVGVTLETESGVTAEDKMQVDKLKRKLRENDDIDAWDFATYVGGQRIMEKLGKKRYEDLPLAEIAKISFRGKVIYTKEAEV